MSGEQDETQRQRQEINMFSAMAGGDYFSSGTFGATDTAAATTRNTAASDGGGSFSSLPPPPSSGAASAAAAEMTNGSHTPPRPAGFSQPKDSGSFVGLSQFSLAAGGGGGADTSNSGTFNMVPTSSTSSRDSSARSAARNFNLEAAAAALADPPDHHGSPPHGGGAGGIGGGLGGMSLPLRRGGAAVGVGNGEASTVPPLPNMTPMHVQQVFLPRPLFFGSILPPRVLKEARKIVKDAMAEAQDDGWNELKQQRDKHRHSKSPKNMKNHDDHFNSDKGQQKVKPRPKISRLRPEVRNLISCLGTYGHGVSVLPEDEETGTRSNNNSEFKENEDWRGTSYVSVYCPAWGSDNDGSSSSYPKTGASNGDDGNTNSGETAAGAPTPTAATTETTTAGATTPRAVPVSKKKYLKKPPLAAENLKKHPPTSAENPQAAGDAVGEPLTPATAIAPNNNIKKAEQFFHDSSSSSSSSSLVVKPDKNGPLTIDTSSNDSGGLTDRDLFSMWARGEDAGNGSGGSSSKVGLHTTNDSTSSLPMDAITAGVGDGKAPVTPTPVPMSDQDLFSQWARGESPANDSLNRRDSLQKEGSFAGGGGGNSQLDGLNSSILVKDGFFNSGTFMPTTPLGQGGDDSDDDSVVGSELKKKVGVNEHLNAALASLEEDFLPTNYSIGGGTSPMGGVAEDSPEARITQVPLTADSGRPLTNLELMNGCTPLFGVDDSPLPVEADLGIHETKDEQQRSNEQRRNQAFIENCCPQNVFGPVACPNPAKGPDDNHSWNSRSPEQLLEGQLNGPRRQLSSASMPDASSLSGRSASGLPSLPDVAGSGPKRSDKSPSAAEARRNAAVSPKGRKGPAPKPGSTPGGGKNPMGGPHKGRPDPNSRFGWWNVPDEPAPTAPPIPEPSASGDSRPQSTGSIAIVDIEPKTPLQLPPAEHSASAVTITTKLEPTPEKLQEQNRPLSHLHPATSLAQALPLLSDRNPSYRYLQVDTQAVGFPTLGGEVEPFFCSLAIYHVETMEQQSQQATAASKNEPNMLPIPNLQRCGKITETLNFDVVSDPVVEKLCSGSLYPFLEKPPKGTKGSSLRGAASPNDSQSWVPESERTQGTRCGVFPIASNLKMRNLYAILIVHKVVSETTDFEAYLRPNKGATSDKNAPPRHDKVDLEALRLRAEKAANRQGRFIMPLAFGVAPLLQVFSYTENPSIPSSRAVQIPLFRFYSGQGERQIIDHVMVMMQPATRGDQRAADAARRNTNGGTAMLVMRNYGYLGLHSVVHSKSSLARDRLVDFTGELQIRRKEEKDKAKKDFRPSVRQGGIVLEESADVQVTSGWRARFHAEPTSNGGRFSEELKTKSNNKLGDSEDGPRDNKDVSTSQLYAQELAPLPLQLSPSSRPTVSSPGGLKPQRSGLLPFAQQDIEPFYHTSFCNELLCHPRLLHNCPKGNIVVKVEMREMEWQDDCNAYFAYTPAIGPNIHNPRRGPFLISGAFTSCSSRCLDSHFLDEFKMKLPLELNTQSDEPGRVLSVFFTVYRLSFSSRKKWARRLRPSTKRTGRKVDEIAGDLAGEGNTEMESSSCRLIQLACGYLPLVSLNASLINNGLHDVKMMYQARTPQPQACETGKIHPDTLIVSDIAETSGSSGNLDDSRLDTEDYMPDGDAESVGSSIPYTDTTSANSVSETNSASGSVDGRRGSRKQRQSSLQMALQVRIVVYSSLHAQNSTLGEFFHQEPDFPSPLAPLDDTMSSLFKSGRDEILRRLASGDSLHSGRKTSYEVDKLLISTVDLSKPSLCSVADISGHFLRVALQLWKVIVSGTGEPDLAWANPASVIPLRVHSFATLLQLLGSSTLFFSKRGVTQLEGKSKWNLVAISRVIALLFDEGLLFGDQAEEAWSNDFPAGSVREADSKASTAASNDSSESGAPDKMQKLPKEKRRRHIRSNFEIHNFSLGEIAAPTVERASGKSGKSKDFGTWSASSLGDSLKQTGADDFEDFLKSLPALGPARADSFSNVGEASKVKETKDDEDDVGPNVSDETQDTSKGKVATFKIDSKNDFRFALEAGSVEAGSDDALVDGKTNSTSSGANAAMAMIKAFSGPQAGSRRWMTAPAPNLATIREDSDGDVDLSESRAGHAEDTEPKQLEGPLDELDTELYLRPKGSSVPVKQMRVPKLNKSTSGTSGDEVASQTSSVGGVAKVESFLDVIGRGLAEGAIDEEGPPSEQQVVGPPKHRKTLSRTLPTSDAEIESAGAAFLDVIGKSIGLSGLDTKGVAGEGKQVGSSHHKKTRSRCSIDWTIPEDNLTSALADVLPEDIQNVPVESRAEFDETLSTLTKEKENCTRLPNFVDRLMALGNSGDATGRWFPFAYEIIIMQWVAILVEQRASSGDSSNETKKQSTTRENDNSLSEAASRTGGVIVACAPVLFEIIKQSLGWRLTSLLRKKSVAGLLKDHPPLVTLDDALQASLEQLISMITDACLDSRNFDSHETKQTCTDVNDSIVHFLRDLFAFLDPTCVHRLMVIYMSRFVVKDGRPWQDRQDRDSQIGLRCSWEITKLQMSAVSAFARFPNFVRVNAPQMVNWKGWWTSAPAYSTATFYDDILDHYHKLAMPSYVSSDVGIQTSKVDIPSMRPHWLAEVVIDICLAGIEHVEPPIHYRASALLHELFWTQSQQGLKDGTCSIVASMYITFLEKILRRTAYLSTSLPKSQTRKDILPCVVFILQSAPSGLLRAVWRRLFARATSKEDTEKFGGAGNLLPDPSDESALADHQRKTSRGAANLQPDPDVFDMFSLLNLTLCTIEYEGSDDYADAGNANDSEGLRNMWRKEFLLALEYETADVTRRRRIMSAYGRSSDDHAEEPEGEYTSTSSRRWHAHDGALVVVNAAQQIVRELRFVLEPSENGQSFLNPARRKARVPLKHKPQTSQSSNGSRDAPNKINFSYGDTIAFVRAATSVYLQSLTLRQSDITLVKTFKASVEIIKIFGIKIFNESVGETLQHWMRVVSLHCGSRRAEVRVPASDFLELILRSTWDSFGSFFRIRLPLLAVQTEVMERIVATAAARHYRDQRRLGTRIDLFSNGSAEASLAPLWRTLDRLHHQSASQNVAFRSALIRLAQKLKKLFRAYVAAHALSFLNRAKIPGYPDPTSEFGQQEDRRNLEAETLIRATRISVHRVINASAGYSKQFLGFYSTALEHSAVAHNEAVEDAFLDAADVFSPTELPDHRVAWLRKLAEFHSARDKFAEEATCHFHIHLTLKQASRLHGSLWSSTPFLPWTNNMSDGIHLDGEGPASAPDDYASDLDELPDINYGRQMDKNNSFRRIFYRVANSIRVNGGDWESGVSKYLFYGVTLAAEYHMVTPWMTLREMEANMLEEAEAAGNLFLQSGIIESSRYAWGLATQYYAEKFSYGKLAHVYERLARTVVSNVPPIDVSLQQEACVAVPLGRFYRVWFHGGAPDELIGAEFVYRTASGVKLEQFGKELREVIRCIIPDKTPIHLVLDGRPEEVAAPTNTGFSRMAGAPLEPVRIKVTPLRPLVRKASRIRGLPEWFSSYIDTAFAGPASTSTMQAYGVRSFRRSNSSYGDGVQIETSPHRRDHGRSYSASIFSSSGSGGLGTTGGSRTASSSGTESARGYSHSTAGEAALVGADKFSFLQSINKDRSRGGKDWLKGQNLDFAEKTLRVTQLQVGHNFPACVSRQSVVHRVVYTQSPLEAGIDSICQWCAVLFRTAIATNGMALLGTNLDPGIGNDAAKVVADCIHSSRVKEMGIMLLKKNTNVEEEDDSGDVLQGYDRLGEDEVKRLQLKLARSLVVFVELLHLLIARNRDLLLDVIQERKKGDHNASGHSYQRSFGALSDVGGVGRAPYSRKRSGGGAYDSASSQDGRSKGEENTRSNSMHMQSGSMHLPTSSTLHLRSISGTADDYTVGSFASGLGDKSEKVRTDSAIAVQSELQRAFISLSKALHPMILGIMGSTETPRWLKQCCQENYFSAYTYRQTKIPIGEELAFFPGDEMHIPATDKSIAGSFGIAKSTQGSVDGTIPPNSPGGSIGSGSAVSTGSAAAQSVKSLKSSKSTPFPVI